MLIAILLATCDLGGATLGICDCGTQVTDQISFELCGSQGGSAQLPGESAEVPMRLCEYYVNGTIDEPTLGRIAAWVPVGSRLCIGDQVPEPAPPRTIDDDIDDSFLAFSSRPWAYWRPGGDLEVEVPAVFRWWIHREHWYNPTGPIACTLPADLERMPGYMSSRCWGHVNRHPARDL